MHPSRARLEALLEPIANLRVERLWHVFQPTDLRQLCPVRLLGHGCTLTTAVTCRAGCKERLASKNRHAGSLVNRFSTFRTRFFCDSFSSRSIRREIVL